MKKSITKNILAALLIGGIMTMGMSGQMTEAASLGTVNERKEMMGMRG